MNLSDAIQQYLADRHVKGIKPGTIRNDKATLQLLLADVGNIQTGRLRPQHIDLFWSKRTTWGPGTMNKGRYALASFFKWCQARGHIDRNRDLLEGNRKIRVAPRKRVIIPQSEFEPLLDSIQNPRARVIAALGLYLFLRISETKNLRWQDIDLEGGTAEVFRQKTQTLDTLPLCSELIRELKRWKLTYAATMGQAVVPGWYVVPGGTRPLFTGKTGGGFKLAKVSQLQPYTKGDLFGTVRRTLEEAGYYEPMEGGHTFRRSGAIALYNQLASVGHDRAIRICQAMLGHASIQTTEIYLRLDLDRKVRNDLLAGQPMFPAGQELAEVLQISPGGTA